jgi:hypothetical protein
VDDWDVAELDGQRVSFLGWLLDHRAVPGDVGQLAGWVDGHGCCAGLQATELLRHLSAEHRDDQGGRRAARSWSVAMRAWRESTRR